MQNFWRSIFLVLLSCLWSSVGAAENFCYDENDPSCPAPDKWPGFCSNGSLRQSPIAIPNVLTPSYTLRTVNLNMASYQAASFKMTNNGDTVVINLPSNRTALRRYENYRATDYVLDNIHFHWGRTDNVGSEHCLEGGRCFSMEMHLVHYRKDLGSVANALASPDNDTLAVLGVFLDVGNSSSSSQNGNPQLVPIVRNLGKVESPSVGPVTFNEPVDFRPFFGGRRNIITYRGSLTTPNCTEKVNWNVLDRAVEIGSKDVNAFRTNLKNAKGQLLDQNFRPLQNRNDRPVYRATLRT